MAIRVLLDHGVREDHIVFVSLVKQTKTLLDLPVLTRSFA